MSGMSQCVYAREFRLKVVLPVEPSCRSPVQIPRQPGAPVQPQASGCTGWRKLAGPGAARNRMASQADRGERGGCELKIPTTWIVERASVLPTHPLS